MPNKLSPVQLDSDTDVKITKNAKHEVFMEKALEYAQYGVGKTNPEPLVGAVIAKGGKIIGTGYYEKYGAESAETSAINYCFKRKQQNKKLKWEINGASLYINHEPQDIDAIINSGVTEIYIGTLSRDYHNLEDNMKKFQAANIKVVTGI